MQTDESTTEEKKMNDDKSGGMDVEQAKRELVKAVNADKVAEAERLLTCLPESSSFSINDTELGGGMGRSLLFHARSAEMARMLIEHGADPSVRDKYGRTAGHVAAERQRIDVVRLLLEKCPSLLTQGDEAGNVLLHEATDPDLVRFLICECGADVNCANYQLDTPLHQAARSGRIELAKLLLSLGADAHRKNHEGRQPLHQACEQGHKSIVHLILSDAINPPLSVLECDDAGWSPLHLACLGAFPEHQSHTSIVEFLLSRGANVHARDISGLQPIHVCTDTSAVRLLLAAGADPRSTDNDERTPLHLLNPDSSVVLLEPPMTSNKEDVAMMMSARDRFGRTPLHLASDPEKARLLIAKGAEKDVQDKMGETPLDLAIVSERPDVVRVLREFGAHTSDELRPSAASASSTTDAGFSSGCSVM